MTLLYKYPRLYLNAPLAENAQICLGDQQAHYLRNVLRREEGDYIRVFNGREGEFLAKITKVGKKEVFAMLEQRIAAQAGAPLPLVLYFAPIKKARMDFLIEKAVELGVTALKPVITARTENRKIDLEKMFLQVIEAAEQCERLDLPQVFAPEKLSAQVFKDECLSIFVALERAESPPLHTLDFSKGAAFFIGPEGGFSPEESDLFEKTPRIRAISLGKNILRAETASLACLSYAKLSTKVEN